MSQSRGSAGSHGSRAPEWIDPSLARDRTALAWTRSALNMAGSGVLIARAGFDAHLNALGVVTAIAMATMAALTFRHGQVLYRERLLSDGGGNEQTDALGLLTGATVLTAVIALVVTIAI